MAEETTDNSRVSRKWWGYLIAFAFLLISAIYGVTTPIFEAPDELWHYRYIVHVAAGKGLPVQSTITENNVAQQEGSQPPLYYVLNALVANASAPWTIGQDVDPPHQLNPLVAGQKQPEGVAMLVHTRPEGLPWRGTILLVHILRLFSSIIGAVTVLLIYHAAELVITRRTELPALAAAFVAFNPMIGFIFAAINNDTLLVMWSAVILLLVVQQIKVGVSQRSSLLVGVVAGLSALTKISGLVLLPLALIPLAVVVWRYGAWRTARRLGALTVGSCVAVSGWWYIRNWWIYGDPFGLDVFLRLSGSGTGVFVANMPDVSPWMVCWMSFWGLFGWTNVPGPWWFYAFYALITGSALSIIAFFIFKTASRKLSPDRAILLVLSAWLAVYFVALTRWVDMVESGAQGRLLFPAAPALAILIAYSLSIFRARYVVIVGGCVALIMGLMSITSPFLIIQPAYKISSQPGLVEAIPDSANATNIDFDGHLQLIGYEVRPERVRPGQYTVIDLYWMVQQPPVRDLALYLQYQHRSGQRVSFRGAATYITGGWRKGDILRATHRTQVPSEVEPLLLQVRVGLYDPITAERLVIRSTGTQPIGGSVEVARLKIDPPSPFVMGAPIPPGPAVAMFGDGISLASWEVKLDDARPGGAITGALYWKAMKPIKKDYTVFVQMLGQDGLITQSDLPPQGGEFPTSLWGINEIVPDTFRINVPKSLAPGSYLLIVGLYYQPTMERLPAKHGDHLRLLEVIINPR
jgi:4-amino-4-deoxy-L-arabinose transferase-like glycosyltransferase